MSDQTQSNLTLGGYFDRILYISMPSDVDRRVALLQQFSRWSIKNVEWVEGVEVDPATLYPSRWRNFIDHSPKYIKGQLGCAEAHIKAVELAKSRGWSRVLILEDDIEILQDPNRLLTQNQELLNDWDMLYFGGLVEPQFRNQIVCTHAYAIGHRIYDDIIQMARPSGMEIDNFYAKVLQHMSYNHNQIGKWRIRRVEPFNQIVQNKAYLSHIR